MTARMAAEDVDASTETQESGPDEPTGKDSSKGTSRPPPAKRLNAGSSLHRDVLERSLHRIPETADAAEILEIDEPDQVAEVAEAPGRPKQAVPEKRKLKIQVQRQTFEAIRTMLEKSAASKGDKRKREEDDEQDDNLPKT